MRMKAKKLIILGVILIIIAVLSLPVLDNFTYELYNRIYWAIFIYPTLFPGIYTDDPNFYLSVLISIISNYHQVLSTELVNRSLLVIAGIMILPSVAILLWWKE